MINTEEEYKIAVGSLENTKLKINMLKELSTSELFNRAGLNNLMRQYMEQVEEIELELHCYETGNS